jgi:hypothetical protein
MADGESCWASPSEFQLQGRQAMKRSIGLMLLAVWLILTGIIPLVSLSFQGLNLVMAILAIAAGVLIAIGR